MPGHSGTLPSVRQGSVWLSEQSAKAECIHVLCPLLVSQEIRGAAPRLPVHSPSGAREDGGRPVQGDGGLVFAGGGFGRSIQDFWFRTFPLHSEKEGEKGEMEGGVGGPGEADGRRKAGGKKGTFPHLLPLLLETPKRVFYPTQNSKTEKVVFFFPHTTQNFLGLLGSHSATLKAEGQDGPLP